jgi:hypothetical protein
MALFFGLMDLAAAKAAALLLLAICYGVMEII